MKYTAVRNFWVAVFLTPISNHGPGPLPLAVLKGYPRQVFSHRETRPERIDTGDYTPEEYTAFLREIRFINRHLGDRRALRKVFLPEIKKLRAAEFSLLDVGAGTGELLSEVADLARANKKTAHLVGLDLNERSACEIAAASRDCPEIAAVRGDAFMLPFADNAFDYSMCSLFTHHLSDEQIPLVLVEMSRVARRGIFVIDLKRSSTAWVLYQIFCFAFGISPLVRQDGLLSIRKGFTDQELRENARSIRSQELKVMKVAPFRLVLRSF
ncbi:MAG: methyltransferase domain-containing protein [Chloracidobacterium sp.]|nr:methyltransferase domain-containing protein [Chloracidobacterium sp.]